MSLVGRNETNAPETQKERKKGRYCRRGGGGNRIDKTVAGRQGREGGFGCGQRRTDRREEGARERGRQWQALSQAQAQAQTTPPGGVRSLCGPAVQWAVWQGYMQHRGKRRLQEVPGTAPLQRARHLHHHTPSVRAGRQTALLGSVSLRCEAKLGPLVCAMGRQS